MVGERFAVLPKRCILMERLTRNDIPLSRIDPAPDYEQIIESCGGYGERITSPKKLPDALSRAVRVVREEGRQVLLNVVVSEVV